MCRGGVFGYRQAIALAFAAEGAVVTVNYRGHPKDAEEVIASEAAAYVTGSTSMIDGGIIRQAGSL